MNIEDKKNNQAKLMESIARDYCDKLSLVIETESSDCIEYIGKTSDGRKIKVSYTDAVRSNKPQFYMIETDTNGKSKRAPKSMW